MKNTRNVVLFLINAIIFALVHYKLSDFTNLYFLIPALFQFSLGLILIWITINFGLKISMIFHALCNLLVIVPLVIVLQFPDKRQNEIINAKNTLKWEKTSVFGPSTISYTDKVVSAERVTIDQFLDLFHENKQGFKIEDSLRFYRYNFELKSINGEKIDKSEIDKILKQSKLINQE